MALARDVGHQDRIARAESSLIAIAGGHFDMTLQANNVLRLRWMDRVTAPSGRQPDELKAVGILHVGHKCQRRRRSIIGFVQIEGDLLKVAFARTVGPQICVPHDEHLSKAPRKLGGSI